MTASKNSARNTDETKLLSRKEVKALIKLQKPFKETPDKYRFFISRKDKTLAFAAPGIKAVADLTASALSFAPDREAILGSALSGLPTAGYSTLELEKWLTLDHAWLTVEDVQDYLTPSEIDDNAGEEIVADFTRLVGDKYRPSNYTGPAPGRVINYRLLQTLTALFASPIVSVWRYLPTSVPDENAEQNRVPAIDFYTDGRIWQTAVCVFMDVQTEKYLQRIKRTDLV